MQCIRVEEDRALAGDLEGVHTQEQTTEEFRFGEFAGPEPLRDARTQVTSLRLSEYPTARAELRLRLPSDRYFADGEPVELSPRNYGILLHRVFEQATTTAEIKEAIRAMTLEGSLDEQEAGRLRRMVAQDVYKRQMGPSVSHTARNRRFSSERSLRSPKVAQKETMRSCSGVR